MTAKTTSDFDVAIEATPTIQYDFLTVEPFDEDGGDLCPEPEAIVRFVLGDLDADLTLEQHFLVCPDCRIEYDALRNVIGRLGDLEFPGHRSTRSS